MSGVAEAVLAIALMAAITVATRVGGPIVMQRIGASDFATRFLDAMASSVLAALVASFVARGGLREAAAVAVAALAMLLARNAIVALVAGMALGALWTQLAG